MSLDTCFLATKLLVAVWVMVSTAEWLVNLRLFGAESILSWEVLSLRQGNFLGGAFGTRLSQPGGMRLVLVLRMLCGFGLLLAPQTLCAPLLGYVVLSTLLIGQRCVFGGDGSDQMGLMVSLGLLLMAVGAGVGDDALRFSGAIFICGQSLLAYFVAGAAKAVSPIWRGGDAMLGVMRTQSYGHPTAARLVATRPRLAKAVCWLVFGTECLYPLVLFAPAPVAVFALASFAVFHLSNAYFMGLNAFVWPFLATYPAMLMINGIVTASLF